MNSEFTIAVQCLVVLASAPNRLWNSASLSEQVHTHPARVRKIMSALREHGLVATKEGLGGGYRLGCKPAQCSLARIYQATSCEALKLNWRAEGTDGNDCADIRKLLDQVFANAENLLNGFLDHWTLDVLAGSMRRVKSASQDQVALTNQNGGE
ncbi:RrF2 family transcriptional regulator [Sporolactobacillus spathodeae]|uniref:Rrf2 family protein n=1 Tax=Sporolactobacillus spathodeae TaxID=1465502 RepID=A0ABS2Q779_9BACL|nr:Rrf2 family transcriptional regulator [Sporolactobacillus spathodeae]MBM7657653.1 Rrf2 family protein [Sporolactobacillus spathodeae]